MNKKIIFSPFAFLTNAQGGENLSEKNRLETYLKNLCVALISTKKNNPDCDVALVTNITIEEWCQKTLGKNNILIFNVPFDDFNFSKGYEWCLAFYKLCALKSVLAMNQYDDLAYTDADVFVQNSFDDIWKECEKRILLYDICHGLQVKDYQILTKEFSTFSNGEIDNITHYGGEFFAANVENAKKFMTECESIYQQMRAKSFLTTKGDEFILSLAAYRLGNLIKNAGAYVYRFWTREFRLTSTCYKFNPVVVLHVPNEKEDGFLKIYDYYLKHGELPKKEKVHHMLHLDKMGLKYRLALLYSKILRRQ